MDYITERVVILRLVPYGDSKEIITALGELSGPRVTIVRKNNDFMPGTQLLAVCRWVYTPKSEPPWVRLKTASLLESFAEMSKIYEKFLVSSVIQEMYLRIIDSLTEEPQRDFRLFVNSLCWLRDDAKRIPDALRLLSVIIAKRLLWGGYHLVWDHCVICENSFSDHVIFDIKRSGWACSHHTLIEAVTFDSRLIEETLIDLSRPVSKLPLASHPGSSYLDLIEALLRVWSYYETPMELRSFRLLSERLKTIR